VQLSTSATVQLGRGLHARAITSTMALQHLNLTTFRSHPVTGRPRSTRVTQLPKRHVSRQRRRSWVAVHLMMHATRSTPSIQREQIHYRNRLAFGRSSSNQFCRALCKPSATSRLRQNGSDWTVGLGTEPHLFGHVRSVVVGVHPVARLVAGCQLDCQEFSSVCAEKGLRHNTSDDNSNRRQTASDVGMDSRTRAQLDLGKLRYRAVRRFVNLPNLASYTEKTTYPVLLPTIDSTLL
jgi:hypothetical protein